MGNGNSVTESTQGPKTGPCLVKDFRGVILKGYRDPQTGQEYKYSFTAFGNLAVQYDAFAQHRDFVSEQTQKIEVEKNYDSMIGAQHELQRRIVAGRKPSELLPIAMRLYDDWALFYDDYEPELSEIFKNKGWYVVILSQIDDVLYEGFKASKKVIPHDGAVHNRWKRVQANGEEVLGDEFESPIGSDTHRKTALEKYAEDNNLDLGGAVYFDDSSHGIHTAMYIQQAGGRAYIVNAEPSEEAEVSRWGGLELVGNVSERMKDFESYAHDGRIRWWLRNNPRCKLLLEQLQNVKVLGGMDLKGMRQEVVKPWKLGKIPYVRNLKKLDDMYPTLASFDGDKADIEAFARKMGISVDDLLNYLK